MTVARYHGVDIVLKPSLAPGMAASPPHDDRVRNRLVIELASVWGPQAPGPDVLRPLLVARGAPADGDDWSALARQIEEHADKMANMLAWPELAARRRAAEPDPRAQPSRPSVATGPAPRVIASPAPTPAPMPAPDPERRVAELEARVAKLEAQVAELLRLRG
ncbi:MAG: hypothetical protein IT379_35255 [Deltaproteobacteria bacterium]|nr:hypothetical protein [Deltaproteobacteria bacterium]